MTHKQWNILVLIVFLFGLLLRLLIATRDITTLDRFFVPDDTYYTLTIARSIAEGKGPTVDGVTLTNGFQPLLAFLLTPIAKYVTNPDSLLRIDLIVLIFFDSATIVLIAFLTKRLFNNIPNYFSLLAALFWAISSIGIANTLGGLETSLAVFFTLLLIEVWYHAHQKNTFSLYVFTGIIAGLSLLSRIDTCFAVGILGIHELIMKRWKQFLIIAVAALIVVFPWWLYQIYHFGTIIPESGSAVKMQAYLHQLLYLNKPQQVSWAFGTLLDFLTADSFKIRMVCVQHSNLCAVLFLFISSLILFILLKKIFLEPASPYCFLLIVSSLLLCWFYVFYVPALWFFNRYLATPQIATTILVTYFSKELLEYYRKKNKLKNISIGFFIIVTALNLYQDILYLFTTPSTSVSYGLFGAKGYRKPALQILSQAPENSIIGAFQSGALSYYAPIFEKNLSIINLDGVVDRNAAFALKNYRLAEYARNRNMTHFADWDFNKYMFILRSGEPGYLMSILKPICIGEPQTPENIIIKDRFTLYKLDWETLPISPKTINE